MVMLDEFLVAILGLDCHAGVGVCITVQRLIHPMHFHSSIFWMIQSSLLLLSSGTKFQIQTSLRQH